MTSPLGATAVAATPDPNAARSRLVCLVLAALGGGLALLSSAQPWASGRAAPGPGLPALAVSVAGRQAAPGVGALALVTLAGIVALLATRSVLRLLVAALLVLAGVGVVATSVAAAHDPVAVLRDAPTPAGLPATGARDVASAALSVWPWVAVLAGVLVVLAGLVALVTSRRWAGMSARYDRPVAAGSTTPVASTAPDSTTPLPSGSGPEVAATGQAAPTGDSAPTGKSASTAESGSTGATASTGETASAGETAPTGGTPSTEATASTVPAPDDLGAREDLAARQRWDALDAGIDPTE